MRLRQHRQRHQLPGDGHSGQGRHQAVVRVGHASHRVRRRRPRRAVLLGCERLGLHARDVDRLRAQRGFQPRRDLLGVVDVRGVRGHPRGAHRGPVRSHGAVWAQGQLRGRHDRRGRVQHHGRARGGDDGGDDWRVFVNLRAASRGARVEETRELQFRQHRRLDARAVRDGDARDVARGDVSQRGRRRRGLAASAQLQRGSRALLRRVHHHRRLLRDEPVRRRDHRQVQRDEGDPGGGGRDRGAREGGVALRHGGAAAVAAGGADDVKV
mmetsp:Transcript_7152/g.29032  ORF Transcript_7152/g.29032 Transcript_7152/m.29032 type:complete len:269 (+) Transcript_7152:3480-4286(+)